MAEFDVHVAAEGYSTGEVKQTLLGRGYTDDNLASGRVTYFTADELANISCPIIGLHMSLKGITSYGDIKEEVFYLKKLFDGSDQVGYVHAEVVDEDVTIVSDEPYKSLPWPVEKFDAERREQDKDWDLHIAIPRDNEPQELAEVLLYENSGLYYIDVGKTREGKSQDFRVYTIQGVTSLKVGRMLYETLENWFRESNVPHAEMKLEITTDMFRFGNPRIVPPTVTDIHFLL